MIKTKEDEEKLLALLLALASRAERMVTFRVRPVLADQMYKIRDVVLRMKEGSKDIDIRSVEWVTLKRLLLQYLRPVNNILKDTLYQELRKVGPPVRELAAEYLDLPKPPLLLRSKKDLAAGVIVINRTLGDLLGDGRQLGRLAPRMTLTIDKTVALGITEKEATKVIADKIIPQVKRGGTFYPTIAKGSTANAILNQITNTTSGAVWDLVNEELRDVWGDRDVTSWIWQARLDPLTCPVCAPLNGEIYETIEDVEQLPPLHPNCRCVVMPRGFS